MDDSIVHGSGRECKSRWSPAGAAWHIPSAVPRPDRGRTPRQEHPMRSRTSAAAAALLAGLALAAGARPAEEKARNLLVNGSFEEGPEVDAFTPLDKDSDAIKGWKVTRAQIDFIGNYWKSADGNRSLDLNGSPGVGGIAQTFATRKGQKYKVTFALAGNPAGGPEEKKMMVEAAGQKKEFTFNTSGKTLEDMGWKTHSWEFTADDDKTTLEFYSTTTEGDSFGPAL